MVCWWGHRCLTFKGNRHHQLLSSTRELASSRSSLPHLSELGNALRVLGKVSFAYVDWDGRAAFEYASGSEPFSISDASRLEQGQVVQCGPEGYETDTKGKDKRDERPP